MRRIIVILFLSLYSIGNIIFPGGDLACLHEMYAHCETEDPDLNAVDFVFEHLLSIPDIFDYFESEDGEKEEKPHQPFHYMASVMQVAAAVARPVRFECRPLFAKAAPITYPLPGSAYLPAGYLSGVFRPPIA